MSLNEIQLDDLKSAIAGVSSETGKKVEPMTRDETCYEASKMFAIIPDLNGNPSLQILEDEEEYSDEANSVDLWSSDEEEEEDELTQALETLKSVPTVKVNNFTNYRTLFLKNATLPLTTKHISIFLSKTGKPLKKNQNKVILIQKEAFDINVYAVTIFWGDILIGHPNVIIVDNVNKVWELIEFEKDAFWLKVVIEGVTNEMKKLHPRYTGCVANSTSLELQTSENYFNLMIMYAYFRTEFPKLKSEDLIRKFLNEPDILDHWTSWMYQALTDMDAVQYIDEFWNIHQNFSNLDKNEMNLLLEATKTYNITGDIDEFIKTMKKLIDRRKKV